MCGFVGIINFSEQDTVSKELLISMNNTQHHRGPDEDGYFVNKNVGLGFKRLSIIDLKSGQQPMSDYNDKYKIVFNGEIYNYLDIKQVLKSKGYQFRNNSDTEVVLNSYIHYGSECVQQLRGMFSFVIWDSVKNTVFMARDRFGIKPMHYLITKKGIVFASELKGIIKSNYSEKQMNYNAIDSFFTYGYILSPNTIYSDIKKLPAAHTLSFNVENIDSIPSPCKYWHPTFSIDNSYSFDEYSEKIREKLNDSVAKHLISDVPVGAFLSGGIDSNAVVANAVKHYGNTIKTFTIAFEESKYNEAVLARTASEKYGTNHHELTITKQSADTLESIINLYDEPFGDSSAIPTYFVSKLASEHVKVVLSGDGGDEFFGGYGSYKRLMLLRKFPIPRYLRYPVFGLLTRLLPSNMTGKRFSEVLTKNSDHYYAYFNQIPQNEHAHFYTPDVISLIKNDPIQTRKIELIENSISDNYLSKMMELDILTYLTDDILTKVDRASMANSIEVRVPIIDHEFFELASKIPSDYKIQNGKGKFIFRSSMRDYIPNEVFEAPKHGFTIPINKWFKDDLKEFVLDNLTADGPLSDFINPLYINKLRGLNDIGSLITRVWPLIVFNLWLKNAKK